MMSEPYFEVYILRNGRWLGDEKRRYKAEEEAEEKFHELIDEGILSRIVESPLTGEIINGLSNSIYN